MSVGSRLARSRTRSAPPSLVKLFANALVALIELGIPKAERRAVESALRNARVQVTNVRTFLIGMLIRQSGKKLAGEFGDELAHMMSGQVVTLIGDVFEGSGKTISEWLQANSERSAA